MVKLPSFAMPGPLYSPFKDAEAAKKHRLEIVTADGTVTNAPLFKTNIRDAQRVSLILVLNSGWSRAGFDIKLTCEKLDAL